MANKTIRELTELAETPAVGDVLEIQDISDTTDSASGTSKFVTKANLVGGLATSGANSNITSLTGLTTPLSVAQGGTAASDATGARTSLGLAIGTNVQAYDAELAALAGLTSAANKVPYFTGSGTAGVLDLKDEDNMASDSASAVASQQSIKAYIDAAVAAGVAEGDKGDITVSASGTTWTVDNTAITYAKIQNVSATDKVLGRSTAGAGSIEEIACTSAGRAILDDANAEAQRTTLGVGTIATQDASSVAITGGSVAGITDLAVADGGTGASTAADAFTALKQDATTSATGVAELATTAETTTGTDTGRVVTPDGLSGSIYGKKTAILKVVAEGTAAASGDGKAYFTVPSDFNGMNLVDFDVAVYGAPTASGYSMQLHNATDSQDMLSTAATIDASEYSSFTAATAPVINASYDDVATGDRLRIDIDGTSAASGTDVIMVFQTP